MNVSKHLIRSISSTPRVTAAAAKGQIHPGFLELHKIQSRFQVKDGKPIFLKAGARDSILYRITMLASLVGLTGIAKLFYELSYPAKPE